jgi:hypothetical protein
MKQVYVTARSARLSEGACASGGVILTSGGYQAHAPASMSSLMHEAAAAFSQSTRTGRRLALRLYGQLVAVGTHCVSACGISILDFDAIRLIVRKGLTPIRQQRAVIAEKILVIGT